MNFVLDIPRVDGMCTKEKVSRERDGNHRGMWFLTPKMKWNGNINLAWTCQKEIGNIK